MANRNFARAMRRKTQWAGLGDAAGAATIPNMVTTAAGTNQILSLGVIVDGTQGLFDEEVTVTRMIGTVAAKIALGTASLFGTFAMGCIVARGEAIAAGVGSLADPMTDPDAEWLFYTQCQLARGLTADIDNGIASIQIPFDTRGQRIVRAGSNLVWVAAVDTGSANVIVGVSGRYLVKLT